MRRAAWTWAAALLGGCASALGADIDTVAWGGQAGLPATAQSTGFTELTGTGLLHASEPNGEGVRNYLTAPSGEPLTFALWPAGTAPGDAQRLWFALRLRRQPGSTFGYGENIRVHQLPTGALKTTMYVRDENPVAVPNGSSATPLGWSVHAQTTLPGGQDVSLVNTGYAAGIPVVSWDRWSTVEIEVVRGAGTTGRYVVLINGIPVSGVVGLDTSALTVEQIAASMRITLPALNGVGYDVGGPIGYADTPRVYDRGGRVYGAGASIHRLLSVPGALDAPWSPFTVSGEGVTFGVDAFVTSGLAPNHRRVIMTGNTGQTGAMATEPLGEIPAGPGGWATVVLRTVLVTPNSVATIRVGHPGAAPLVLTVQDGLLWCNEEVLLGWSPVRRYAVLLHMRVGSAAGERAITLVDLSAETFFQPVVTSAALPPLGAPITALGSVELGAEFQTDGGTLEWGGVAACRRVDMPMVDSYVGAFGTLPSPKLVTLSRLGSVSFAGTDADLVPGRPANVNEPAEAPMYLFPVARSGRKLSNFLATSAPGAAGCRGARWVLACGWVNDLTSAPTPEDLPALTGALGAALRGFVQDAVAGGNEVVLGTAITPPLLVTFPTLVQAFLNANNIERALCAEFAPSGRVRLADVDALLSPLAKNRLFSPDGVHFSATGDMGYWQALIGQPIPDPPPPAPCGPSDLGGRGGEIGPDGLLDNNDFVVFIDFFFASDVHGDVGAQGGAAGPDGWFDNNDFVVFIDRFFAGCP